MSAEQTKKTVMAIVKEVTPGTPVKPTGAGDYLALQEGFDIEPAFESLENTEFTGSLGNSKPILGLENPSVSLSHYIRHSGMEGIEPDFGLILEGAFGAKKIVATERDTTAGSTAGTSSAKAVLNVGVGEGVEFERGQAVLIKDAVRSIRNVESVSVDALTLNFNLASAPASGVNLGKAVLYKPAETHPSLSIWNFRGNGTAMELVAGARVTELSIEANAGELINGSFTMNGVEFFFNPIDQITSSNNKIDFEDDVGVKLATVPVGYYKDPHDLAAAIQSAMNAVADDVITVVYNNITGKFTISSDGVTTFDIFWQSGANTAQSIKFVLGFNNTDDTGAFTYTSDNPISLGAFHTPAFDSADPLVAKNNEVFMGHYSNLVCFCASTLSFNMTNTLTDVLCVCAESGKQETLVTSREVSIEITSILERYEADIFRRFRENETTQFMYNFGFKSGGNWVEGKSCNLYVPTATISSWKIGDNDGIISLEATLTAFVDAGKGEVYLNFL